MYKLLILSGDSAGNEHQLKTGSNVIGRSRSADVNLSSMDVSGRHARILIEGESVFVENMSQYGTFVDGSVVEGRVEISSGQILKMGKGTEIKLEKVAEDHSAAEENVALEPPAAPFDDGPDTGEDFGVTMAATGAAAETGGAFDNDVTVDASATGGAYDDEEGATRAMHTRAATPDEIQHLKEKESKHVKQKMVSIVIGVVVLLALGVIFRPRTPPPELEISWPMDEQKHYMNRFEPGPSGGREKDQYDVCYPDNGTFKKSESAGGFVLSGFIGRDKDVPMRIIVQEEQDLRLATLTREQIVADWIEMIAESGGAWRINKPSTLAVFFGDKNGIPYTRVTYLRDDGGKSWFGVANVMRHGRRRIVVRAESLAVEQARVEYLLSSRLVYVADAFQYSYWPYTKIGDKVPVEVALEQVRHDLERMAPGTWMSLDKMLCGLLSRVVPTGDAGTEKECLRLLVKLRENEALWFNSQQLAYESALVRGEDKLAKKIVVFTEGVFSHMSDQRYYTVRKWNVELEK